VVEVDASVVQEEQAVAAVVVLVQAMILLQLLELLIQAEVVEVVVIHPQALLEVLVALVW
jgi:hypothetical protein